MLSNLLFAALLAVPQPDRAQHARLDLEARRGELGLGSRDGFQVRNSFTNPQGETVVHLDHTFDGHRVWGSRAVVRVKPGGQVSDLAQDLVPRAFPDGRPLLTPQEAVQEALKDLAPQGPLANEPSAELVVLPAQYTGAGAPPGMTDLRHQLKLLRPVTSAPFVWAYEVHTAQRNPPAAWAYLIDARTGRVLRIDDELRRATPAQGSGLGYYSGQVAIDTAQMPDGTYALFDPTRGALPNPVLKNQQPDGNGWSSTGLQVWYEEHDTRGRITGGDYLFRNNPLNTWGDGHPFVLGSGENNPNGQTAGVDALYAMQKTWDFYATVFGRNGLDGQGTTVFTEVYITEPGTIDDSFWWTGNLNYLVLGAGSYPGNPDGRQSATELDFIAHEMTHGVIYATSRLQRVLGEEAAIEEATCDFFAQMVKAWLTNPGPTIPDADIPWEIGRGIGHGTPLRWMDKPSRDQRSVDNWYDGIKYIDAHWGSGAISRALYYLARGAPSNPQDPAWSQYLPQGMPGIGNDAAARIWYKTVTERLTGTGLGKNPMFAVAKDQAIQVALELWPDDPSYAATVQNAFAAVNVGDAHGLPPHVQVAFEDFRDGDYIVKRIGDQYSTRQVFPMGATVRPRVSVHNAQDTSVTWSLGGPSTFNADSTDGAIGHEVGGVINADGSWSAPWNLGWFDLTATSNADPRQYAEGRSLLINTDTDMDLELDAVDLGGVAFSWYLPSSLNYAQSVSISPFCDDEDVFFIGDALRAAWPAP